MSSTGIDIRPVAVSSALLVAILLVCPAAPAAEKPAAPRIDLRFSVPDVAASATSPILTTADPARASLADLRRSSNGGSRFLDGYLVPKLSRQMDIIAPAHPAIESSAEMIDYLFYDDLTHSAERRARKGARQALESYLVETTPIGNLFHTVRSKKGKSDSTDRFDVGVGVSHWLPEVEMRFRSKASSVRFRVGLHGTAGVTFNHARTNRSRLYLGYNAREHTYGLNLRFGF